MNLFEIVGSQDLISGEFDLAVNTGTDFFLLLDGLVYLFLMLAVMILPFFLIYMIYKILKV